MIGKYSSGSFAASDIKWVLEELNVYKKQPIVINVINTSHEINYDINCIYVVLQCPQKVRFVLYLNSKIYFREQYVT